MAARSLPVDSSALRASDGFVLMGKFLVEWWMLVSSAARGGGPLLLQACQQGLPDVAARLLFGAVRIACRDGVEQRHVFLVGQGGPAGMRQRALAQQGGGIDQVVDGLDQELVMRGGINGLMKVVIRFDRVRAVPAVVQYGAHIVDFDVVGVLGRKAR